MPYKEKAKLTKVESKDTKPAEDKEEVKINRASTLN